MKLYKNYKLSINNTQLNQDNRIIELNIESCYQYNMHKVFLFLEELQ